MPDSVRQLVGCPESEAELDGLPGRGGAVLRDAGAFRVCQGQVRFDSLPPGRVIEAIHRGPMHRFTGSITSGEHRWSVSLRVVVTNFLIENGHPTVYFTASDPTVDRRFR